MHHTSSQELIGLKLLKHGNECIITNYFVPMQPYLFKHFLDNIMFIMFIIILFVTCISELVNGDLSKDDLGLRLLKKALGECCF